MSVWYLPNTRRLFTDSFFFFVVVVFLGSKRKVPKSSEKNKNKKEIGDLFSMM